MTEISERIADALRFANRAHAGQLRKGSRIPYISHPMTVAALVLEYGGSEDQAIGALLHDVMEDAGVTEEELMRRFGPTVAEIVVGCTDGVPDPETGKKPDWRPRKEDYLRHLRDDLDEPTALVSCCDKLANARTLLQDYGTVGEDLWTRFKGGREGTLWYYAEIARIFEAKGTAPHRELRQVVDALAAAAAPGG